MTNPVIDFLTGEKPYEEFMERWNRDDSLLEWIDSNTDMSFLKPEWENLPYAYVRAVIKNISGGSFRAWEEYDRNGKSIGHQRVWSAEQSLMRSLGLC